MKDAYTGYYAIIQYCPDHSRLESANVGVVLVCPEINYLNCRINMKNERIRKFFGDQVADLHQIKSMKQGLMNRLLNDPALTDLENFRKFQSLLANELQISELRPVRVVNPEVELIQLYAELVDAGTKQEKIVAPALFERLDQMMHSEHLKSLVQRNVKVRLPIIDQSIEVPYSYQNGRLNLIQKQNYTHESDTPIFKAASQIAVQGHLLAKHEVESKGRCQMVVVGSFGAHNSVIKSKVQQLLHEHDVVLYHEDTIDELESIILRTAH
jgi:hypothetical protein